MTVPTDCVDAVEVLLQAALHRLSEPGRSGSRRIVEAGGKRLRPELLLRCAGLAGDAGPGGLSADPVQRAATLGAAAAVELLHSATLLHDDLLDGSETRRGVAAVHRAEGLSTAVIAGDALIAQSWRHVARCDAADVEDLADALADMCAGEELEAGLSFDPTARPLDVVRVAQLKTGALLRAACRIGGRRAGLPEPQVRALGAFGSDFGVALQLVDDVLDVASEPALLGKPCGADFVAGTVTMPTVYALLDGPPGELAGLLRARSGPGRSRAGPRSGAGLRWCGADRGVVTFVRPAGGQGRDGGVRGRAGERFGGRRCGGPGAGGAAAELRRVAAADEGRRRCRAGADAAGGGRRGPARRVGRPRVGGRMTPAAPTAGRGLATGLWHTGAEGALRTGIDQLVRRNLRGVWVDGDLPSGGCVWAANHHSWWDFFVAAAALRSAGRRDVGVLMEPGNVGREGLFQRVGVVGTDRLRTAVDMLRDGMVLVVFPEAQLLPAGPVGPVRPGGRWLADRSGADLRAVATRVVLRGQQAPEAYLRVSVPLGSADELGAALSDGVAAVDAAIAAADPAIPLPGFRQAVPGVRSWHERFGALRGAR